MKNKTIMKIRNKITAGIIKNSILNSAGQSFEQFSEFLSDSHILLLLHISAYLEMSRERTVMLSFFTSISFPFLK